ncbi:MAG: DUF2961 domain-containing protein [Candidatus Hinthialibacter antarcticus]|nr:DUF2961 domain-containing protein [Candidatus Hinthialibacter antarcticus]
MFRFIPFLLFTLFTMTAHAQAPDAMRALSQSPDFQTHRISSYDPSGGNDDRISIPPGQEVTIAEIEGPGAITHIWNTISAEKYYPRMVVLRIYWDGQETPSVEAPLGDFFGVGHGLERPFQSLPVAVSADGRARNCYWYMPFQKSARVTILHEGFDPVRAFYYYIDYQTYGSLPDDTLYFHARYQQAVPNAEADLKGVNLDGKSNYVLLETRGKGKYVGSVLNVQTNQDGWFGEGDDMFFIDGAEQPRLSGTGTEDYFSDAWGFREFAYPFYGVTVWEGMKSGDRGTAYRWHINDPIAFESSLKATIEHGHANDREDDFTSTAFWYQTLPSPKFEPLPLVMERLPKEGKSYAQLQFLHKQVALHRQQNRLEEALNAVSQFGEEHPIADEFGYLSMRRGLLLQEQGKRDEALEQFQTALRKSQANDPANERDAFWIRQVSEREIKTLDEGRSGWAYITGCNEFELYWNGEKVGGGNGWVNIHSIEIDKARGKAVIAARCRMDAAHPGWMLHLGHRAGVAVTDETWNYSLKETEGWNQPRFDDSGWGHAAVKGELNADPWRSIRSPFAFYAPLFAGRLIGPEADISGEKWVYFRKEIQIK